MPPTASLVIFPFFGLQEFLENPENIKLLRFSNQFLDPANLLIEKTPVIF